MTEVDRVIVNAGNRLWIAARVSPTLEFSGERKRVRCNDALG